VVAGEGRTPIVQHSDQPAVGDHRRDLVVEDAGKTQPRYRSAQDHRDVVEHQLSVDTDVELPTTLLKLPGVESADRRQPEVYALVLRQVLAARA